MEQRILKSTLSKTSDASLKGEIMKFRMTCNVGHDNKSYKKGEEYNSDLGEIFCDQGWAESLDKKKKSPDSEPKEKKEEPKKEDKPKKEGAK